MLNPWSKGIDRELGIALDTPIRGKVGSGY